jgi:uncharacterized protein
MPWPFRKKTPAPAPAPEPVKAKERATLNPKPAEYPQAEILAPVAAGVAMDSKFSNGVIGLGHNDGLPQEVGMWYASQGYIGPLQASWIARHWLVDKAINMPARDSLRQGWELETEDQALAELMESADKKYKVGGRLHEFVAAARRTGGAVAVMLTCPTNEVESEYYEAPLNLEAVTEYHGIAIIDAVDANPMPDQSDLNDPASTNYMCPSYFQIGTKRYHKSHCITLVPFPVSDTLKPSYKYFGQSLPERIYERVYAAERTANEAPLLAMTKRLRLLGVDIESVVKDGQAMEILEANVRGLQQIADNFGVFVYDTANGGGMSQLDTALGDFDALVMTQYQLVAAIAEVPSTKLLGTQPKGFAATGESEAEDYRQALESIQTHDLQPLLERHYQITAQVNGVEAPGVVWMPLDSPTAREFAEIDQMVGGTIAQLVAQGVITQDQSARILSGLQDSIFSGLDIEAQQALEGEADDLLDQVMAELENESNA